MEEIRPIIESRNDSGAVGGAVRADDLPQEFDALPREFCLASLIDESGIVLKTAQEAEVELGRESLVRGGGVTGEQDSFPVRESEQRFDISLPGRETSLSFEFGKGESGVFARGNGVGLGNRGGEGLGEVGKAIDECGRDGRRGRAGG